jgi:hypothetical protein
MRTCTRRLSDEPEPVSGITRTREQFLADLARAGVVGARLRTPTRQRGTCVLRSWGSSAREVRMLNS